MPAARKAAGERGIDLDTLGGGSGPGGRILSSDVAAASAAGKGSASPTGKESTKGHARGAATLKPVATGPIGEPTRKKASGMRKAIARNLVASKQNVPHFYMKLTVDAGPVSALLAQEKSKYKVSVNDILVLAVARVIMEFPAFKSQFHGDEVVEYPSANIGIAVGMDEGLVVPVVIAADRMSLKQVAGETRRVAEAARGGKIEGMGQGVFTISNLGMFGIEEFSAIINPPESGIIAASAIREDVIVKDGAIRAAKVMTLVLSCDHRIVDGLAGAKFLARLKDVLEAPEGLG